MDVLVDRLQLLPVLGRAAMNVCVGAQENHYFHVGKKARKQLQSKPERSVSNIYFCTLLKGIVCAAVHFGGRMEHPFLEAAEIIHSGMHFFARVRALCVPRGTSHLD